MKNLGLIAASAGVPLDDSRPCDACVKKIGSVFISTMCSSGCLLRLSRPRCDWDLLANARLSPLSSSSSSKECATISVVAQSSYSNPVTRLALRYSLIAVLTPFTNHSIAGWLAKTRGRTALIKRVCSRGLIRDGEDILHLHICRNTGIGVESWSKMADTRTPDLEGFSKKVNSGGLAHRAHGATLALFTVA